MIEDDERRVQRERDIARSVAPADYSRLERDIRANKAEAVRRARISHEQYEQERAGYYASATVQRNPDGSIQSFRPNPTR